MNEIKLTIGGKAYVFTLGLGFLGELLEETNLSLDELIPKMIRNPFKWVPVAMFQSAKYSCELEGIEIDFTAKLILEGLSNEKGGINCKQTLAFMAALNKSLTHNIPVEDDEPEISDDEKKK